MASSLWLAQSTFLYSPVPAMGWYHTQWLGPFISSVKEMPPKACLQSNFMVTSFSVEVLSSMTLVCQIDKKLTLIGT